jgi:hypothetical protein
MRHLYIVPNGHHHAYGHLFDNYHALEINNGKDVIVSVKFSNDDAQNLWESMAPVVQPLPHEFDPSPIGHELANRLAEHGVQPHHTTKDVRKLLKAKHRQM